jgi:uncharacterized protein (TIGR02448 family)
MTKILFATLLTVLVSVVAHASFETGVTSGASLLSSISAACNVDHGSDCPTSKLEVQAKDDAAAYLTSGEKSALLEHVMILIKQKNARLTDEQIAQAILDLK